MAGNDQSTPVPDRRDPDWPVDLPPEWKTGEWHVIDPVAQVKHGPGDALAVLCVLSDGTNVGALTWPGGQALMRTGPPTAYAMEERFDGQSPREAGGKVAEVWTLLTDCLIAAVRAAERELGKPR
jgi:hypothetical protein